MQRRRRKCQRRLDVDEIGGAVVGCIDETGDAAGLVGATVRSDLGGFRRDALCALVDDVARAADLVDAADRVDALVVAATQIAPGEI